MASVIERVMCLLGRQRNHDGRDWFVESIDDYIGQMYWFAFEQCLEEVNIIQMSPEALSHLLSDLHNRAWERAVGEFEDAYRFASILTGQFPNYQRTLMVTWARFAQEASQRFSFIHPVIGHIAGADQLAEIADDVVH